MLWKRDKNSSGSWSITGRLIFWFTVSSFALLAFTSGFLYWVLNQNLLNTEKQFLYNKIRVARTILEKNPQPLDMLHEEVAWESSAHQFAKFYSQISYASGDTIVETPGMKKVFKASEFPKPVSADKIPDQGKKWRSSNGQVYLMMSAWIVVGHQTHKRRLMRIALDVSHDDALMADYDRKMLIVLLFGLFISAIIGGIVARKGMKPLHDITSATKKITSSHLDERINAEKWPREIRSLATEFNEMLARLEGAFNRLSQFSADLAHELRTPINNLMGEAEVSLSRKRNTDEYRQVLESSLEEYGRLSRMIDRLLFLAHTENAETVINKTSFSANEAVRTIMDFYEALSEERHITCTIKGDAELFADPMLFRRAVNNVLSNSFLYTSDGGNISIKIEKQAPDNVSVCVKDDGIGIEKKHLERIFDRFYRSDQSHSINPGGSGLGLAIVKSIMDLHDGGINIESEIGKGTKICLGFPADME